MKIKRVAIAGFIIVASLEFYTTINCYTSAEVSSSASVAITDNAHALVGISEEDLSQPVLDIAPQENSSGITVISGENGTGELFVYNRVSQGISVQLSGFTGADCIHVEQKNLPLYVLPGTSEKLDFNIYADKMAAAAAYQLNLTINATWTGGSATLQFPVTVTVKANEKELAKEKNNELKTEQ